MVNPRYIIAENVPGLISIENGMVLEQVCSDLESENYQVQPFIIPACAVNAPHRRDRVWIIAHRTNAGIETEREGKDGIYGLQTVDHATSAGSGNGLRSERQRAEEVQDGGRFTQPEFRQGCQNGDAADTMQPGQPFRIRPGRGSVFNQAEQSQGCKLTRNDTAGDWKEFPTQSPLRTGNDGFPGGLDGITVPKLRNESIKAAGNAIVPAVALQIFKAINEYELIHNDSK